MSMTDGDAARPDSVFARENERDSEFDSASGIAPRSAVLPALRASRKGKAPQTFSAM